MDYFLLFFIIGFSCLVIGFLGYKLFTEKIIKEQENEIAQLKTENRRLQAALRGRRYVRKLELNNEYISNPKAVVKPDFKEW